MSALVDPTVIEKIVGVRRHSREHYGRAVSAEQTFYILHSQRCLDSGVDLRECVYSVALDEGIKSYVWDDLRRAARRPWSLAGPPRALVGPETIEVPF
jgi:hypothetical protein